MLLLKILGIIFAVIILLLDAPIRVHMLYKDKELLVNVYYGFIKLKAPGVKKEKKTKPKKEAKKEKEAKEEKEEKLGDTIRTILALLKKSGKAFKYIFKKINIYRLEIYISTGGETAAEAATRYGKISAGIYAAVNFAKSIFTLSEPVIAIAPNFLISENDCEINAKIKTRPINFITLGLYLLINFVKLNKKKYNIKGENKSVAKSNG